MSFFRRKPVGSDQAHAMPRVLSGFDLVLMGIGAIIGAGVFVLTGAAAVKAGPAIMLSFMIAGLVCALTAFAYAELAASIGGCGSAYGYAYAGMGEAFAWLIGWALILEYGISTAVVAIGWSGYVQDALRGFNVLLPHAWAKSAQEGGTLNILAFSIQLLMTWLLARGAETGAKFNKIMVFVKIGVIALFILFAAKHVRLDLWHPFMPNGWDGVFQGAALIFFAYIGFDAVSTAAEEAVNPSKDLPIGILGSLLICTLVYVVVSGILTGIVPYHTLGVSSPVADAMLRLGHELFGTLIAVGAIAGLTTVVLVMFFGMTRIVLAMARDGLLPPALARLDAQTQTPRALIWILGISIAFISGFFYIGELAELVNIGTLFAFALVNLGVVVMRVTQPDLPRPFKTPFGFLLPLLGALSCFGLMFQLPGVTWLRFGVWIVLGFVLYLFYGRYHALLGQKTKE